MLTQVFPNVDRQRKLVFLTNNCVLPATNVAQLYRCRWQIELFLGHISPVDRDRA